MKELEHSNIQDELQYIKGVGPKKAEALIKSGLDSIDKILHYFPRGYIERSGSNSIKNLLSALLNKDISLASVKETFLFQSEVTVVGKVIETSSHTFAKNRKLFTVTISDDSMARAKINFWNRVNFFEKLYKKGQLLAISGKPEIDTKRYITFTHPEIELIDPEDTDFFKRGGIIPKYRITEIMSKVFINSKTMRNLQLYLMDGYLLKQVERLPKQILKDLGLPNIRESIKNLHFPETREMLDRSLYRMKFEEMLYYQIALQLKRKKTKSTEMAPVIKEKSEKARLLYDSLPFELTADQKKVLKELDADFRSGLPMNRLLQGDVGSGKTITALLAMLMAIDNDLQTAIMAPTELLAEQHYHTLSKLTESLGVHIVHLTGSQRTASRRDSLYAIETGTANIIVGTHAMFQNEIKYRNLGFIVIDEQHRFGVAQRAELIKLAKNSFESKYLSPHILVMSATPIPRTLSMTVYGDLDISIIKTMPKNRMPIKTKVAFNKDLPMIYEFIKGELEKGRQAYIVYPLVEKSEKLELKSAVEHFELIRDEHLADYKCALLHGQMHWTEKEEIMKRFLAREYQVLVATTVIEVGIDVPNASVMVIENAERFGLSQLHQLRGRIGRGTEQSYCILITKDNFIYPMKRKNDSEMDRSAVIIRLKAMEETLDGFKIAEIDLKLRGPGDMLGTKQSGLPDFNFINIAEDADIIALARTEATNLLETDPKFQELEHKPILEKVRELYLDSGSFIDIA
jgi:ATP-dependent DNA helicase RecG